MQHLLHILWLLGLGAVIFFTLASPTNCSVDRAVTIPISATQKDSCGCQQDSPPPPLLLLSPPPPPPLQYCPPLPQSPQSQALPPPTGYAYLIGPPGNLYPVEQIVNQGASNCSPDWLCSVFVALVCALGMALQK